MLELKNPYPQHCDDLQKVSARVCPHDLAYLKRLLPLKVGVYDKILAILFQKFINELRLAKLDPADVDPFSILPGNPTEQLILTILSEFQRCPAGKSPRPANTPRNRPTKGRRVRANDGDNAAKPSLAKSGNA